MSEIANIKALYKCTKCRDLARSRPVYIESPENAPCYIGLESVPECMEDDNFSLDCPFGMVAEFKEVQA